ncbi:hypothetical protein KSU09_08400 [Fusobacterium nucleatum]|uniref:hypothetical protein n=1 Tax=Fusobacterium nucleatum TaxID=851 RepID=UPI0030CD184A
MAIKIKLEKDGFIKDGFVGYSFTTFFFNILVPAFRLDFNAFIVFLGISLFQSVFPLYLMISMIKNLNYDEGTRILYSTLIYYPLNFLIAFLYNKNYTTRMLRDGWYPLENDEYSNAILKGYNYLEYSERELKDFERLERYNSFFITTRKKEKRKWLFFLIPIVLIILLILYFLLKGGRN